MAYSGAPALNLLAAAKRVWNEVRTEIKAAESYKEGPLLPAEELKKVPSTSKTARKRPFEGLRSLKRVVER